MQQEKNASAPQPAFTSWVLNLLKEHYGLVSAIAAALGILNLAIYTHHIGRPDVFMSSLELGPGLILLWITHLFFFAVLIGSMLFPSLVFSGGLSVLRPKPEYAASIVRVLTAITAFAMLGVVIPIGAAAYQDETASAWWALTVLLVPALCSLRIPRHSDTQPTLIRTPVPRSFGQAVGAQRRRGGIVSLRCPASSISSLACASIRP